MLWSRQVVGGVTFCVLISALVSGCAPSAGPAASYSVRDSANIEIVESNAPILESDHAWTVSPAPILQIGEADGEEPYLFSLVRAAFRTEDDRVVVCDGRSRTIRFFNLQGEFVEQVGGSGDGPGELRILTSCHRFPDGIVAFDQGSAEVFDRSGSVVASISFPMTGSGLPYGLGVFSDGSALVSTTSFGRTPGIHLETTSAFRLSHDGLVLDSLVGLPYGKRIGGPEITYSQAFGPVGMFLSAGENLLYGWSEEYDIDIYGDSWELEKRIRRSWEPKPVSAEDQEWWTSTLINGPMPGGGKPTPGVLEARRKIADIQIFPTHHAAFDVLKMDTEGCLWVRRTDPRFDPNHFNPLENTTVQRIWDVFDPEGIWVTSVSPPIDLEIHDIGRDYILGVWRDEMGVEYVREYALERSAT